MVENVAKVTKDATKYFINEIGKLSVEEFIEQYPEIRTRFVGALELNYFNAVIQLVQDLTTIHGLVYENPSPSYIKSLIKTVVEEFNNNTENYK